jgi:hypothetical protein
MNGILGTNSAIFVPDSNDASTTNPLNPDSDGGGIKDGTEDFNRNGDFDAKSETDPNAISDDALGFYIGNLVPNRNLQFEVRNGRKFATFIPAYSLAGAGPTPIAGGFLDIHLSQPIQQLSALTLDGNGNLSALGPLVPGTAPIGLTVWFHALEVYLPGNPGLRVSNAIELSVSAD